MNPMLEDINHLSREIGARPGGTEEERLAAMYIAENIQKRSGLPFDIEDFEGAKGRDRVHNFLSIASAVLMFIAILLSVTTIPAFIITALIAVLLVLEYFDKPFLSNFFRYGISQNVVAKYVPAYSSDSKQVQRKRKVVLVSRYDSGRSLPESNTPIYKYPGVIKLVTLFVDCFIPLFLAIKMFAFPQTTGALTLFCLILSFVFIIISILPTLLELYTSRLLYNEGANCNASANAVLIEIAKQLGTGAYSTDEDFKNKSSEPVIHGKEAAESSGLVPENAEIKYETKPATRDSDIKTDVLEEKEQSLADAKAAIAAFTSPRKPRTQYDDEGNIINGGEENKVNNKEDIEQSSELVNVTIDDATAKRIEDQSVVPSTMPDYKIESKTIGEVPDWFKSAQSKAKKDDDKVEEKDNTQRSRFAHTMDVMAQRQEDEIRRKQEEEEEKRAKLRAQIEAANKAAEEERKKKFAEKEQPFVEKSEILNDTETKENIDMEKTTQDEKLINENRNNQNENVIEEKNEETKLEEKKEEVIDNNIDDNKEDQKTVEDTQKFDLEKTTAMPLDESFKQHQQESKPTALPEHSGPIDLGDMKQYAPLDDQEFISGNEMPENNALQGLPEVFVDTNDNNQDNKATNESANANDKYSTGELERGKFGTGSFAAVSHSEGTAGATGAFAPVKEELISDASKSGEIASKDDMVVEDADDSVYSEGEFTDTGAFAGKDYVDMPEEKRKGLFGLFGKKDKGGKHSGKDENKSVGRGDRNQDNIIDDDNWDGGAFSNLGSKLPFNKSKKEENNKEKEQELDAEEYVSDVENDYAEDSLEDLDAPITSEQNRISSMVDPVPDFEEQIQEFHDGSINMEVWLVALGSEINENAGINAFLLEHSQELRGSIIIDLEALGSGELSLINSEGIIRKSETSSRLKRYVRQAANKLNVVVPSVDISWGQSSAAYANKKGFKTLKLAGMDGNKPSHYMQKDDLVENIDVNKLTDNVKYILQLIQSI